MDYKPIKSASLTNRDYRHYKICRYQSIDKEPKNRRNIRTRMKAAQRLYKRAYAKKRQKVIDALENNRLFIGLTHIHASIQMLTSSKTRAPSVVTRHQSRRIPRAMAAPRTAPWSRHTLLHQQCRYNGTYLQGMQPLRPRLLHSL